MIIGIDVGNTYITCGGIEGTEVLFFGRCRTAENTTVLEHAIWMEELLHENMRLSKELEGAVISCVVPSVLTYVSYAAKMLTGKDPVIVSERSRHGLRILLDDPKELGPNLIADAAAGKACLGLPFILLDMGTATSIAVIDEDAEYLGGVLLPGVQSALDELSNGTAVLPELSVHSDVTALGRNSAESMNGGAVYGNAGMIDGIIGRIEEARGEALPVIATGHLSTILKPFLKHDVTVDELLTLRGLALIYRAEQEAEK